MCYFQNSVYICPRNRKLNSPLALKFKVMIATTKLIESYKIIERGLQAEIETATKAIGENNLLQDLLEAYINKHDIFDPNTEPSKSDKIDWERIARVMKLANGMEDIHYRKSLNK